MPLRWPETCWRQKEAFQQQSADAGNTAAGNTAAGNTGVFTVPVAGMDIRFDPACRDESLKEQFNEGTVWGNDVVERFVKFINGMPDGADVVDVGSNIGVFTIAGAMALRARQKGGVVHSFEPVSGTADLLAKNVRHNNGVTGHVRLHRTALGAPEDPKQMDIRIPTDGGSVATHLGLVTLGETPLRFNEWKPETIQVKTLDEFWKPHADAGRRIGVMKIDTEGWETNVMRGGMKTIRANRPIIISEYNAYNAQQCGKTLDDIHRVLDDLGYRFEPLNSKQDCDDIICFPKQ